MEQYITYIVLGIVLVVLGIVNCKGNISTIHRYNRRRVSEADAPKYGKCVGIGTVICGAALLLAAFLDLVVQVLLGEVAIAIGFAAGLVLILYAQFKYNKGIF